MYFFWRFNLYLLGGWVCLLVLVLLLARQPTPRPHMMAFVYDNDLYRVTNGKTIQLTHTEATEILPSYSPDGHWFAFVLDNVLYKMHPFGQELIPVQISLSEVGTFTWSPDGEWLAISSTESATWNLYRLRPDGRELQTLTTSSQISRSSPAWSPDGKWILFTQNIQLGTRTVQIFRMKLDGSEIEQLSDGRGDNWNPRWSPDGEWIAFSSNREIDDEIYRMRPDGSDVQRIGQRPSYTWYRYPVAWMEDWLYMDVFRNGSWGAYRMHADGSQLEAIPHLPSESSYPLSPTIFPVIDLDWCVGCTVVAGIVGLIGGYFLRPKIFSGVGIIAHG